nr:alpha/beta hydrolase [Moraxellaceae bacterium]
TNNFALQLYDPYQTQNVTIHNHSYPLATNFSANYALWINENQLRQVSIMNMLRNDKGVPLPQLYMLEPYNPNKRIIIMVHGLASSPFTWLNLTNDLLNDERLRENYQVWQVFYATNLPMLENRYYIQQLIEQAYQQTVGTNQVPAREHSVIIAHSMGSVISRMMLSNDNLNRKINFKNNKLNKNYQQKLQLKALSPVDTAVFISAPFRGTNFADRWFTKALRDVIKLPTELSTKQSTNPLIHELFLQNGASQLSDKSAFMQLTQNISINKNVTYHNIVGDYEGVLDVVNRKSSEHKNSDGIVPYNSSHLEGAKSETVIEGGHAIHTNPKTILQLRKILHGELDKTQ